MDGIVVTKLKCLYWDCNHEWVPRSDRRPRVCPKCKRYDWDTPHEYKPPRVKARRSGGANVAKKRKRKKESAIIRFKREHNVKGG